MTLSVRLRRDIPVRVDETWEHLDTFKRLYRDTMKRVNAAPYYFFDDAYFDGLREAFADSVHLIVVEIDGQVACASIELESCGIVQNHLGATDRKFLAHNPGKILEHFVRSWAKERGNRWLHLGGGVGGRADALLTFKAGFSRLRLPFYTLRVVPREQQYRRLVARLNPMGDPADSEGFFPAYRLR